jgi:hypothetical protein
MRKTSKILIIASAAVVFYVGSYAVNSVSGGYERSGTCNSLSWSPRHGQFSKGKKDVVGVVYAPLVVIDRKLLHASHVFPCVSFTPIPDPTLTADVTLHPREEDRRQRSRQLGLAALHDATREQEMKVNALSAGVASRSDDPKDEELVHQERILAAMQLRLREEETANQRVEATK